MFKDTKIAGRFHKLTKIIVFLLVITMVMPNLFLNDTWAGTGSKATPGKVTVKSLKTSGSNNGRRRKMYRLTASLIRQVMEAGLQLRP